jgi:hypothetical protein
MASPSTSGGFVVVQDRRVRATTYHRTDIRQWVISFAPGFHNDVHYYLVTDFSSTPASDLGDLQKLPMELIQMICNLLDVKSCFQFRQVNRLSRQIVTSIPQYRRIAKVGITSLAATLRSGMAQHLTFPDLDRVLLQRRCEVCDKRFGGFIYLPTAKRVCLSCLTRDAHMDGRRHTTRPQLNTVSLASFAKAAGYSTQRFRQLVPVMKSLPGTYLGLRRNAVSRKKRVDMVNYEQAVAAVLKDKGQSPEPLTGLYTAYVTARMASAPLPFFSRFSNAAYWGFSCKGCALAWTPGDPTPLPISPPVWNRIFSMQHIKRHVAACDGAKRLWAASDNGTKSTSDMESDFSKNLGYTLRSSKWV